MDLEDHCIMPGSGSPAATLVGRFLVAAPSMPDERFQKSVREPLRGRGQDEDAPDVAFVAALDGRFLIKTDRANKCIVPESAKDEVFGPARAKASASGRPT